MRVHLLERAQLVPAPLDHVFAFFSEARNLERITPEWLSFEVLTPEPIAMRVGTQIQYRLRLHGVALRDRTLVRDRVQYALPLGVVGELAHLAFVRRELGRIFDYRRIACSPVLTPRGRGRSSCSNVCTTSTGPYTIVAAAS